MLSACTVKYSEQTLKKTQNIFKGFLREDCNKQKIVFIKVYHKLSNNLYQIYTIYAYYYSHKIGNMYIFHFCIAQKISAYFQVAKMKQ